MNRSLSTFIFLLVFLNLFSQNNPLEDTTRTISIRFMGWGCDCPNWCESKNYHLFFEDRDTSVSTKLLIDKYCFNIESGAEDDKIDLSAYWDFESEKDIVLTGSFYLHKQDWPGDDRVIKSRVFKYLKHEFVPKE